MLESLFNDHLSFFYSFNLKHTISRGMINDIWEMIISLFFVLVVADTQYLEAWSIIYRKHFILMCHYSLKSIANVSLDDFATWKPNLGRGFVFLYFILISQVLSRSIIKNIISLPSIWQSFDKTINRLLVGWENYLCSFTAIYCFFSELSSYILLQKKTTFDLKAFSLLTLLSNFMQ